MSHRTIEIGVVGWGNFFEHIHEQTVRELVAEGRCRLRAVCVRSEASRAAIAARMSPQYAEGDYRRLLEDPRIDAILIGAPHSIQAELAIQALEAGKWVYVEKPMFADEADTGAAPRSYLERLAAMGPTALERLAVGLNKRFAPAYRDLRERAGTWGGLRFVQMNIIDDAWRWGGKYPPGFLIWLDACHWIDLARWFMGAEVEQVSCLLPQVEDSLLTLRMSHGGVASIFLSGNGTMDMFKEELIATSAARTCARSVDYFELEVFGQDHPQVRRYRANLQSGGDPALLERIDAGGLEAFAAVRREMFNRFRGVQARPDAGVESYLKHNLPNFMRPQGWRESLRSFVESVAAGRPLENSATYRDAYLAYELVEAAKRSAAAGGGFVSGPRLD